MPVWREKAVIPTKGRGASSSTGCDQLGKKIAFINLLLNIIRAGQGLVTDGQELLDSWMQTGRTSLF